MSPRPRFEPEQEFRLAVVMYGGVSLAIYINGVAQELYRLVKATAPAADGDRVYFGDADDTEGPRLEGPERVYRELGQWLTLSGPVEPSSRDGEPPPVRTRFVVDIISGTSAGGINGIFLGKALAERQDFRVSSKLWLEVADIEGLFRGKGSYGEIPEDARRDPESLLNGDKLYFGALTAMREMADKADGTRESGPSYAEQLELAVTATDLAGLPVPIRLGQDEDTFVMERVHRKVFRFEYGTPDTIGEEHSDFGADTHAMLSFCARATSSFPFAFEPVKLEDVAPLDRAAYGSLDTGPWFPGYDRPEQTYFADGGYLDNKPFSYATQALRRRRADLPVTRKLLYIEPDPAPDEHAMQDERPRPDVYQNVADAMAGLPRFEPIRQDIADVAERNRVVARLRDIEDEAVAVIGDAGATDGPAEAAYRMLRRRTVLDRLAGLAATLCDLEPDGREAVEIRDALRDWARGTPDPLPAERLDALDAAFQRRRHSFLQDRVTELLHGSPDDPVALRDVKRALNKAYDDLRRAERAPFARRLDTVLDGEQRAKFERVRSTAAEALGELDDYISAVADFQSRPMQRLRAQTAAALAAAPASARDALRAADERFPLYDLVVLPLAYPDLGEVNAVDIRRISPRDAKKTVPHGAAKDPVTKLAGVQVKHFGAFLDASWRANDMLWGRLDAAEIIVDAALDGKDPALRDRLRIAAQAAILREELEDGELATKLETQRKASPTPENDAALVAAFHEQWTRPPALLPARVEKLAGRAIAVTGGVLALSAGSHHIPRAPLNVLARTGPTLVRAATLWGGIRRRFRRRSQS